MAEAEGFVTVHDLNQSNDPDIKRLSLIAAFVSGQNKIVISRVYFAINPIMKGRLSASVNFSLFQLF